MVLAIVLYFFLTSRAAPGRQQPRRRLPPAVQQTVGLLGGALVVWLLMAAFVGANFVATVFLTWTPTSLVEKFHFRLATAGLSGTAFIHLAALSAGAARARPHALRKRGLCTWSGRGIRSLLQEGSWQRLEIGRARMDSRRDARSLIMSLDSQTHSLTALRATPMFRTGSLANPTVNAHLQRDAVGGGIGGSSVDDGFGGGGDNFVRAHHLAVLVFEIVTVPYVTALVAFEMNDDTRDGFRFGAYGIFPSHFVGVGWREGAEVVKFAAACICESLEGAAIEDLEADEMEMDRMNVVSEIHQVPNLSGVEDGLFGYRLMPVGAVEEHQHSITGVSVIFVERKRTGTDGA